MIEETPEEVAVRDSVQQTVPCNSAVDHAGGIELTSMDSFVSTPVMGVQGARGLPEGRLSPILVTGNAESTVESAVESKADQPRRQSTRLTRTNTGEETAGTSIDLRDTATLANVQECTPPAYWTSGNHTITVDLPLVSKMVGCLYNPNTISASTILADIRRKDSWKLGTKESILQRFAANSVPLLHKTMMLLELKETLCEILEDWTKETPPLSPKLMYFPAYWPLDHAEADAAHTTPAVTREWVRSLLYDRVAGKIDMPERTCMALSAYAALPLDHPTGQRTPNQPAPPESQPTRPIPPQATTQTKQGGSNRMLSSGNTPSFTVRTSAWYETARRTLRFKSVSGGVHLDATLPNLRNLLDAGPKIDLSGLRRIAIDRRKQLDPEKVERHFEDGGQSAEAAYYASVLTQLYGEVISLRDVKVNGKPTGEVSKKRINALGFPAGPSPQETRSAVVTWGKFHMSTWGQGDSTGTALRSAMAAYVGGTVEPNRKPRNLSVVQGSQPSVAMHGSQPSVRLRPTHETDSDERARQWEKVERTQACVIYSRGEIPSWMRDYSPLGDLPFIRSMTGPEQTAFANEIPTPGLAAFIAASTDAALQEREQAEFRKHANNGRTPPWYAPDGHTETPNLDSAYDGRRIWNHAEMAERAWACELYSRGEIPTSLREWSPLEDLTFIHRMAPLEQSYFASASLVPNLAAFIDASTSAVLQAREQAEVQKYAEIDCTPPWHRRNQGDNPFGRSSSSSGSMCQGGTSNQDRPERFQTSPVTASNLPDASLAGQTSRDRSATQIQQTNYFALLGAVEEEDDDRNDLADEADPYDPANETARLFLQQPSAGATVRTMQPTFPPAPEFRPPTMVADPASAVEALDRVCWDDLITPANLTTMREVPSELQGEVLETMRDILKNLNDAIEGPEVEFERWYKLWELFPLLFLRMPPRGGRRGHGLIASRLDAHKQRNYGLLLDWYFSDREIANRAPRSDRPETRERKLKKVLEHTKVGQFSQAMRRITSNGIGDSKRKEIRAQMQRKFPPRKHRVGPLSEYLGISTPVVPKITGDQIARAIRNLAPGTAPGPDGFHVEYLKLTLKAQNLEIGRDVNTEMARLTTAFSAGSLPAHTYYISSGSWLVPVIKEKVMGAAAVVPCRPVCIGSVRERVMNGTIVTTNADNLQDTYLPQQLGFHQNGCEMLPLTVQLYLEEKPDDAAIKLDSESCSNEAMRHAALQFCASRPKLASITPAMHAIHAHGSPLHYHDGTRADDAVDGGLQGNVMAGHLAALALQPVLLAADRALKEHGGCARAIIDDGYLLGPPAALAAVLPEYKKNLKAVGGSLNEAKSAVLLGATCKLPADFPVPRGVIYDGPGGKTGNIVGYGIVCVGIPIGDPAFVKRCLELKEEDTFDKIDRTVELLGPSQSFTGFQVTRACLSPMMDYLARGMDATAYTLPFFMRFDAKIRNTVATLIGHGERWPTNDTAHLGRDAWELVEQRIRLPKRLGGLGIAAVVSKAPVGRVACVLDCTRRGIGSAEVRNQGPNNPAPARIPLFPASLLDRMRLATGGSLFGMKPLLSLQTSIGEAFEVNWATCQQLADEGTQLDPTQIETPLNWPPEQAGSSVEGTPLVQTQKTLWRQMVKVTADKLDLKIRALHSANPVYMAWIHRDRHSTMFANVIPTDQYNLTNEEFWTAVSSSLGITNPLCIPHIGTSLVRKAPEEDEDDADMAQRGDEVDAFGFKVSSIVQGGSWKTRHDRFEDFIVMLMKHSGMSAKGEPRGVVSGQIPRPLLRDRTQEECVHRVVQGAIPDVAYTNPSDGKEKIAELKFINQCQTRYGRDVATSLRAAVNKREQQLYQEYLTELRLKDRRHFHTPAGTVGPLERGIINATNSGENFDAWVVGFYGEWSDKLTKLPEVLADAQIVRWQSKYGREPTDQQRSWLVSKVRSDIAMMATKLNAQVIIKNLQNMHEKSLPPTGARRRMELAYQDWARLQGRGPHTGGPFDRTTGWRSW